MAEENPLYFWQFVERLQRETKRIAQLGGDVDAVGELAVDLAEQIRPDSKSVRARSDVTYYPRVLRYECEKWADTLPCNV